MQKRIAKVLLTSLFAVSLLGNVGCGRRLVEPTAPVDEAPPGDAPPVDAPVVAPPAAPPGDLPPPADPGGPPPPVDGPPPTDPGNPPPPGDVPPPTDPGGPPPPVDGPNDPPPPAGDPVMDEFYGKLGSIGFTDPGVVNAEILKTVNLNITGWSQGKNETPDANIEALFEATKGLFEVPPANPTEYFERSMSFASQPGGAFNYYIDMKVSGDRGDIFILKHDTESNQIVGINEKDVAYETPAIGAMSIRARSISRLNAVEGKIFFYAEERGQFLAPDRFLMIPAGVLNPQLAAMRVRRGVSSQSFRRPTYSTYRAPARYPVRR